MTSIAHPRRAGANPLRRWRALHQVTQEALAQVMRVHPSMVSQWEKQRAAPTLEHFDQLQRHTGIDVTTLLRFFVRPVRSSQIAVQSTDDQP